MKKLSVLAIMILLLTAIVVDMNGQVRKRTSTKKKSKQKQEQVSLLEKINPEIKFGNLSFFNGLSISSKLNAGYKFNDRFSAGVGGKFFYDQRNVNGPSLFDLGGFGYGRAKIVKEIYFQTEYAFMSYDNDPSSIKLNYPLVGLGYMSGFGKWKFGIELMYVANAEARTFQNSIVEYWFGASYNF